MRKKMKIAIFTFYSALFSVGCGGTKDSTFEQEKNETNLKQFGFFNCRNVVLGFTGHNQCDGLSEIANKIRAKDQCEANLDCVATSFRSQKILPNTCKITAICQRR